MKKLLSTLGVGFIVVISVRAPGAPFRIGSGQLTARVEHPFRIVELTTGDLKANFVVDPGDLTKPISLEAHVPTAPLLPPSSLGNFLQARLAPEIVFKSLQVETLVHEPGETPAGMFQITFRGQLISGEHIADARVHLQCQNNAPAVRCLVFAHLPITALGLPVPRMLWVKAKNDVAVQGEIFFAPVPVEGAPK